MSIRISGAFTTRWKEEWYIACRIVPLTSWMAEQRRIGLFLEAMAPEIAKVLLEPAHAQANEQK